MAGAQYQAVFPTRLSRQKQSAAEFTTTANGFRMANSVDGGLLGRGGNMMIVDDALKPHEALSETQSNKANRLHAQTATIENGFVYLPKEAPWLMDYIIEMTSFPKPNSATRSTRPRRRWTGSRAGCGDRGMGVFNFYKDEGKRLVPLIFEKG